MITIVGGMKRGSAEFPANATTESPVFFRHATRYTYCVTTDPSPTADATRLVEEKRESEQENGEIAKRDIETSKKFASNSAGCRDFSHQWLSA
jgi:hypothetical protein